MTHFYKEELSIAIMINNGNWMPIKNFGYPTIKIMDESEIPISESNEYTVKEFCDKYGIYAIVPNYNDISYTFNGELSKIRVYPKEPSVFGSTKEFVKVHPGIDNIKILIVTNWKNVDNKMTLNDVLLYHNMDVAIKYLMERGMMIIKGDNQR